MELKNTIVTFRVRKKICDLGLYPEDQETVTLPFCLYLVKTLMRRKITSSPSPTGS